MGKSPVPALFKAFVLILLGVFFYTPVLRAQTDFPVGTGTVGNDTATYPCPLADKFEGSRAQYLFLASELKTAGLDRGYISGIKFKVEKLNGVVTVEGYTIKMATTTLNSLDTKKWEAGATELYTTNGYTPVLGVNTFNFSSDFYWNGVDNIIVEVCSNGGSSLAETQSANPTIAWTTGLPFLASHTYGINNVRNMCTTSSVAEVGNANTRPNMTFRWKMAPPDCSGTPGVQTTISDKAVACPVENFNLSLQSAESVRGLTYQWQSSPDNITWTNITGATASTYTSKQNVVTYYRAMVTCTLSGQSTPSTTLKVDLAPSVSGTFIIDNSVPASGGGTFKSFQDAYNYIKCGINGPVVFNVVKNAAPYNEQLIMVDIPGTSATNTVTFNGNGAAILYKSTVATEAAVIKLNGTDWVSFDNLIITASGSGSTKYGFGVQLLNDADNNTVKNCTINIAPDATTNTYAGIVMSGDVTKAAVAGPTMCDFNSFDHNTINGGTYGITLMGSINSAIQGNKVTNNIIKNFYQYGIYMEGNNGTLVEANDFSRPNRLASLASNGFNRSVVAIAAQLINLKLQISKNKIHALKDAETASFNEVYGIVFVNSDGDVDYENIVSNNLIYDIKGNGPIYGIFNLGSNGSFYYHNTISLDQTDSKATGITAAFYFTSNSSWIQVKNNLVSVRRTGTGFKYAIYFNATPDLMTADHNDYFIPSGGLYNIGYANGDDRVTLADWIATTTLDSNSLNTDPGYQAPDAFDFKPNSALLNDNGIPVGVGTDIVNASRSTTVPDIGAYEFSLPACLTNSNPGEAFTNKGTSSCPNMPISLNLRNNDVGLGLTYQWQSATSAAGPWTNISDPLRFPPFVATTGIAPTYYRAALSCNGGTPVYSVPVLVVIGEPFPGGTYTIDNTLPTDPTGTKNFNSFNDAVAAISCGIGGPVVFNVKDGTYTEQVRIPEIPGASNTNTVSFIGNTTDPSLTKLSFAATDPVFNYVLQLDSAKYVTLKSLQIEAPSHTIGRLIDISSIAAYDSIVNCILDAPAALDEKETSAGIYAVSSFKGGHIYIKGNQFRKGAKGVYIQGFSATKLTDGNQIDGNLFTDTYHQPVYVVNGNNTRITNNDIRIKTKYNTSSFNKGVFGIYASTDRGVTEITGNKITASDIKGNFYGIFINATTASTNDWAKVSNNKIIAINNMSGLIHGLSMNDVEFFQAYNNAVSVKSSKNTVTFLGSTALYSKNAKNTSYYNNTFLNSTTDTTFHVAAYFDHQYFIGGGNARLMNNIIANTGAGPAIFINYTANYINSDYNLLYAKEDTLVRRGPSSFAKFYSNISEWRNAYYTDLNSISYKPALLAEDNLEPNANDAGSWAMQGRGVQLTGNDADINGNPRPTTLEAGVPDIGAYEFFPAVEPPVLAAEPATPAPGTTQWFRMGTDTVAKITWAPASAVPTSVTLKRYSGVLPAGLASGEKSMYFYSDIDAVGTGAFNYSLQHFYVDSWLRNIPKESFLKLGKTDAANQWIASTTGQVDSLGNSFQNGNLDNLDKFTGLTDGKQPEKPVFVTLPDSSNLGRRFWLPYASMRGFRSSNDQELRLFIGAQKDAKVQVSVNGTTYSKQYTISAGTILKTDELPKSGVNDARIWDEGLSNRGILVESDEPVSVHAFVYGGITQAVVLPTGSYGYDYSALNFRQNSGYPEYGLSWVNVIADHDNTEVEITPSVPTAGGRTAGVPFRVTLNRGEVYQVLGAFKQKYPSTPDNPDNAYEGYELSGTRVVSVSNSLGKCQPIAVFSGSAGTSVFCDENHHSGGGEAVLYQQNFPVQGWGKKYLTAPLNTRNGVSEDIYHIYRVLVRDQNTLVKRNGVQLTNKKGSWYEFTSNTADLIEADQPVLVAQYNPYFTSCGNDYYFGAGIQEGMTYLTPLGYGIRKSNFMRNKPYFGLPGASFKNYLTVILPNEGLSSLKVDNSNSFDKVYAHPQMPGYSVAVKMWDADIAISYVACDTSFTAIASLAGNGAHFYNLGMQIPRVDLSSPSIQNVYNISGKPNTYTCAGTPFKPSVLSPVAATSITWSLSAVAGVQPGTDITVNNPVPSDIVERNFKQYFVYTLPVEIQIPNTGDYMLPVSIVYNESGMPAGCGIPVAGQVDIKVINAPSVDFTTDYKGCVNSEGKFTAIGAASAPGETIDRWSWNFGDNTVSTEKEVLKKYNTIGNFLVKLQGIATDGCVNQAEHPIQVTAIPPAEVDADSIGICVNESVTFNVKNPQANITYSWYDQASGGTALATGNSYTLPDFTGKKLIYLEASEKNGCSAETRKRLVGYIIPTVTAPVLKADSIGFYSVRFSWQAVPNATGYEVSANNGNSWTAPSSGTTGLSHIISGLASKQSITLIIRSKGRCADGISEPLTVTTLDDKIFIPNTFTPNGDGRNDQLKLYAQGVREMTLMIFNQWGEKIYETNSIQNGWDGTYKGQIQSTGVYMYVCRITTIDGNTVVKKGSVNLIR